jgi:UDP-N-acetylglucosamine diphosphorylase/glucosamine-1-phosphate N-acetyltransferase
MIITIFEDQDYKSLFPLNINRASFELRCGAFTNVERVQNLLSPEDSIQLIVRDELVPLIQARYPNITVNPNTVSSGIWLNGRGLWTDRLLKEIIPDLTYSKDDCIMAVYAKEEISLGQLYSHIDNTGIVTTELDIQYIKNIWDGIFFQSDIINSDAEYFIDYNRGNVHPSVAIDNGDNIFLGEFVEVRAGSVLDARSGPIIIEDYSLVDIGSLVQGPIYIGPNCIINPGSKLRGNVTLGPMCKIGGEVEDVIFQGYSNKQHDGFLGHSYIGEWVNLGANTNNSDLKNNYGNIRLKIRDETIETGKQFLGTMMGDYSRTGISTMLNTGTIIGLGANIFGEGFQDKYIPSFQWGREGRTDLEKFLLVADKMKKRRNIKMSLEEKEFLTQLYKNIL